MTRHLKHPKPIIAGQLDAGAPTRSGQKRRWRRYIRMVVSISMALAAALVLAFGPRGVVKAPPHTTVVEYWEKWNGTEGVQMAEIVNDFNRTVGRRDHIFVRYISTSSIDQKTLTAIAAGVPPDIAGLWNETLCQFAALGCLKRLGAMAKSYGITAASYLPVYWRGCHYHGHLYALVSTPAAVALLYNKAIFQADAARLRAAGLNPNRPPRTLKELDHYAHALTIVSPSGQILQAGFVPMTSWYLGDLWMWFGGHVWNAQTHKFTLTSPAVVRSFQWIRKYSQWLGPQAINSFQSGEGNFDSPENPFLAGQEVMEMQGPWMANYIYNFAPHMSTLRWPKSVELKLPLSQRYQNYSWAFAPFPSAVPCLKDVSYCSFDCLCIPRGAKHPRSAFAFIAYVNQQPVMEKLCALHGKNSPLAKVSRNFLLHNKNPYIGVFEKLAASPNARSFPPVPIGPQLKAELGITAERVGLLKDTPRHALAMAQARLQRLYDAFHAMQLRRQAITGVGRGYNP